MAIVARLALDEAIETDVVIDLGGFEPSHF